MVVGPEGRVTLQGCASFGGDEKRRGRGGASGGSKRHFTFDHAVDEGTSQEEVFELVGKPLADALHRGIHGCLLAYGQTGAGKTFTMQGPEGLEGSRRGEAEKQNQRGLIQRTFERVFNLVERSAAVGSASGTKVESKCSCNYLQIYNEQVQDLLSPSSESSILIREDRDGLVHVEGAKAETLSSAQQAYKMFQRGNKNRKVGSTALNSESSRSHAVFVIHLEPQLTSGTKGADNYQVARRFSSLYLVDLAGSERQRQSQTKGQSLKEAGNINKSLSQLGQTIKSLAENAENGGKGGGGAFVPYRNSKLTFLLKNALVGRSMCSLIANVSPAQDNVDETLSTLVFASRAKLVTNMASVNEDVTYSEAALHAELKKLREENGRLKKQQGAVMPNKNVEESAAAGAAPAVQAGSSDASTKRLQKLHDLLVSERSEAKKRLDDVISKPEVYKAKVVELSDRSARLEKELHSTQLRLRMKEEKIARLSDNVPEANEFWEKEVQDVVKENELLKKQLECPPEVIRYKMELADAERQLQKCSVLDISVLQEKCENLVAELAHTISEKKTLNKTATDSQKSLRKLERAFVEQSAIQEEMFSKLQNGDAKKELGDVMQMKSQIANLKSQLEQVLTDSKDELRELQGEVELQCIESVVSGITENVASAAEFEALREERDAAQLELAALRHKAEADAKSLKQRLEAARADVSTAKASSEVEKQDMVSKIEQKVQKIQDLEKEMSTNEEAKKELVAEVAALKTESEKLRAEIREKDTEIASMHEENVHLEQHALGHSNLLTEKMAENISLQGQLESCIAERDSDRAGRAKLFQANEKLEAENARLHSEMKSIHEQKGVGQAENSRLQAELNSARERVTAAEKEFAESSTALQKEVEVKKQTVVQLEGALAKEKAARETASKCADTLKAKEEELRQRLDNADAEVSRSAADLEELKKSNAALEFQNTENEIRIQDVAERLQASSLERESLQEEVNTLAEKLSRATSAESKKNAEASERARLLQSEVANLMADHATKERVVRQLEEKVTSLESQTVELSSMREALSQAEKSVFELTESNLQLESEIKESGQLKKEVQQMAVYKKEIAYLESAHDETRKHLKVLKHQAHKDKEGAEKKLADAEARVEQLTMLKDFAEARAEELQSKVISLEMASQNNIPASNVERENQRRQSAVMEQVKAEQQVAELREELAASRADKKHLLQELNNLKEQVAGGESDLSAKSASKPRKPFGEISQNATPAKTPSGQKPLKVQDTASRRMTRSMRRSVGGD